MPSDDMRSRTSQATLASMVCASSSLALSLGPHLYAVHVKSVTATQLRKDLFRLLDDVVAGEPVVVERKGRRVELSLAPLSTQEIEEGRPDYSDLVAAAEVQDADLWM